MWLFIPPMPAMARCQKLLKEESNQFEDSDEFGYENLEYSVDK